MKKLYVVFLFLSMLSCNSEDANDCFQTSGTIETKEVTVPDFTKIEVNEGVNLVIKDGAIQKVLVETGRNLMNDVEAKVVGETLILTDHNGCNYVRDYGITTVYVTAPSISEIRSNSQYEVRSDGVLTYENLALISENFTEPSVASGNFTIQIENDKVDVLFNNLSNLFISGTTKELDVDFPGGNSRVEASGLLAEKVTIFTRGSNDIIVHPVVEITGNTYGTGNVIAVNRPTLITLVSHYTGSLIFN